MIHSRYIVVSMIIARADRTVGSLHRNDSFLNSTAGLKNVIPDAAVYDIRWG